MFAAINFLINGTGTVMLLPETMLQYLPVPPVATRLLHYSYASNRLPAAPPTGAYVQTSYLISGTGTVILQQVLIRLPCREAMGVIQ